jgi:ribonucleoside-diphosphate reductase beta chain
MATLLELTARATSDMSDESKLSSVKLMDPQQLYELWERQPWSAHAIDLEQDKRDWAAVRPADKADLAYNFAAFFVGEERVTTQFSGLVRSYETQGEEA